ncbi:MAG: glycosyl transferase group 1 [Planctomycetaceae bacterium]|nr:glycosyl transferase group 1 [Planctomycetaceae bacterium]
MVEPATSDAETTVVRRLGDARSGSVPVGADDTRPHVMLLSGRFQVRGSCTYTLRLARHLPASGIRPLVVCPNARLVEAKQRRELGIREYPYLDVPFYNRLILQRVVSDLGDQTPDLIHVQSRRVLRQGKWLARKLNRPYILTVHDYLSPQEKVQLNEPPCAQVITVSESVKRDFVAKTGVPPEIVTVIPSGVDLNVNARAEPILDPGHVPIIGTAGPLETVKGLPFFLGAASRVLQTGRDVEFLVSGAGPEEANLRRLARELGISSKVTFVPYMLNFSESLSAMDIFCLPSLQQGLGTIMLEAMASGIPVIASRVGGVYGVIHDQHNGLLVPPSNSRQLADRILELLCDPLRARHIGENGRDLVQEEFGLHRMVGLTAEMYQRVIETSASSRAK